MSRFSASYWIRHFAMQQHIEGGWYNEVYRSGLVLASSNLAPAFKGDRNACTHIYFLLEQKGISAFHRIRSDELWHFYAGDPLVIYEIDGAGKLTQHVLGNDPGKGERFFTVIKAGHWFGSRLAAGGEYGLAGCTVSPGFDFEDFELASRDKLIETYPRHAGIITQMTYEV